MVSKRSILTLLLIPLLSAVTPRALAQEAGSTGDYYDNRDNDHSRLDLSALPGVTGIRTGYGGMAANPKTLNSLGPSTVVIGNSSTAYTSGTTWTSHSRLYMSSRTNANALYAHYTSNVIYWYPEHRDNDEFDHFHAMAPFVGTSQGSSGSDLPNMYPWYRALAVMRTDVKARLASAGAIIPTLQMIARRSLVGSDAAYLTSAAHPTTFEGTDINAAMVAMARAMDASTLPPLVRIRVVQDTYDGVNGVNYFDSTGTGERLFDTPASIARIYRGWEPTKMAILSAEDSIDLNNRALTYHWRVLRGEPARVRITPLTPNSARVGVEIDYHPTAPTASGGRSSNLVVIGAFVHNGHYFSAPAFFNSFTLANEVRTYSGGRLVRVDYPKGDLSSPAFVNYVSPNLSTAKSWDSDTFVWAGDGRLLGWQRRTGAAETFIANPNAGSAPTATPQPTSTNTPLATATNTPAATATRTPIATATRTPVVPTATATSAPGGPTTTPKPGATKTPAGNPSPTPGATAEKKTRIVIYAAGTAVDGVHASMDLSIGNEVVAQFPRVRGNPQERRFKRFVYIHDGPVVPSKVRVHFTNDLIQGEEDRNLTVDAVVIDRVRYESEASTTFSRGSAFGAQECGKGYGRSETLRCDGLFRYGKKAG